jgi:hypothetical protein
VSNGSFYLDSPYFQLRNIFILLSLNIFSVEAFSLNFDDD